MQISRRNALLGASAAMAVAGVPSNAQAALVGDPVIVLAEQLNATRKAWDNANDAYDDLESEPLHQEAEHCEARYWDCHARLHAPGGRSGGLCLLPANGLRGS